MKRMPIALALMILLAVMENRSLRAAETVEQLIAGAKKEGDEIVFVAGAQTFGGRKGLAELETGFNKRYGLKAHVNFAAGPDMNARAARLITEVKAGRKSSTDLYLGSQSHFALLHKENALEKVNWSGMFPWVTKEMEIFPGEGVLVYTSPNGIIYNTNLIPKDKAPKNYMDLIDPRLSPMWTGKLAIPPYVAWLAELSLVWGQEKVKDFARKLVALSGGRLRYGEDERIVSGEFPIMANIGDAFGAMWTWQAKGAPLVAVPGLTPINTDYFQLGGSQKCQLIPTWQSCLLRSWFPRKPRPSCRNTNRAVPTSSRELRWRSICAKTISRCRSRKNRYRTTSRATRRKVYSSRKIWRRY